jgi:hypothetical protein
MPAASEAQRALLNARFGHAWVKAHHFDNRGKLPAHVRKRKHGRPTPVTATLSRGGT